MATADETVAGDTRSGVARLARIAVVLACALAAAPAHADDAVPAIVVDRANPDIFPQRWLEPPIAAKAEPLPDVDRARASAIVAHAIAKYPAAFVRAHLRTVYVVGRLAYDGVTAGGTNSRRDVYVVARRTFARADVEKTFHAEFSSIVLRRHPDALDARAWQRALPPRFAYRGTGVQAIRLGQASLRPSAMLEEEGFLDEYAQASLEEDFNAYAGRLWSGDPGVWLAVDRSARVAAKARLVIGFYTTLDPSLTESFFRALAPGD